MARQGATETDTQVKGLRVCWGGGIGGEEEEEGRKKNERSGVCCSQRRLDVRNCDCQAIFPVCPTPPPPTFNAAPHSISSSLFTRLLRPQSAASILLLLTAVPLSLSCHSVYTPYSRSFRRSKSLIAGTRTKQKASFCTPIKPFFFVVIVYVSTCFSFSPQIDCLHILTGVAGKKKISRSLAVTHSYALCITSIILSFYPPETRGSAKDKEDIRAMI